jgi:hypothetical protein
MSPYETQGRVVQSVEQSDAKEKSAMALAMTEGAIEHKRLLDGEITQSEYERRREEILYKHGI